MSYHDEAKLLRIREAEQDDELTRIGPNFAPGLPNLVATTAVLNAYPTAASVFFACTPLSILGQEVEGGAGVITSESATLFGLNLGSAVPPVGTNIVLTFTGDRWVFRYDG